MDIAAASIEMHASQIQSQVNVAVLKKTMDAQTEIAQTLIEGFVESSPVASSGHVDISV